MQEDPTQSYYVEHAQDFIAGTLALDMNAVYAPFTQYLPAGGAVLDAGCGSGRDSLFFRQQGYAVLAIDACADFVRHTRAYAGVPAQARRFEEITEQGVFDGIWASASLLHLPPAHLQPVLEKLAAALKPGGVLYASFKYGDFAGWRHGRWFTDLNEAGLQALLPAQAGWRVLNTWQSRDARPERAQERWLNALLQSPA